MDELLLNDRNLMGYLILLFLDFEICVYLYLRAESRVYFCVNWGTSCWPFKSVYWQFVYIELLE